MKIGFLGTGTISDAVIRGICTSKALKIETIFISKRNEIIANQLVHDFKTVKIANTNQELVDDADIVFVALPGQVCETELRGLVFNAKQKLVSFVPSTHCSQLKEWTKNVPSIFRAMPLPFIKEHKSSTPIYPCDDDLQSLFGAIGGYIIADQEDQFNLFMTAGSMMGVYYRFCNICTDWLNHHGLKSEQTTHFMAQIFSALASEAEKTTQNGNDFVRLQREYSTPGGTNELMAKSFDAQKGDETLRTAIDTAFEHIAKK